MSLINAVAGWLPADRRDEAIAKIAKAAMSARTELELPDVLEQAPATAVADFTPGNGWRYLVVLSTLQGQPGTPFPHRSLLVALPEWNRCLVLDRNSSVHTPTYIDEKIRIGTDHAAVLAVFTTLVTAPMTPSGAASGEELGAT